MPHPTMYVVLVIWLVIQKHVKHHYYMIEYDEGFARRV